MKKRKQKPLKNIYIKNAENKIEEQLFEEMFIDRLIKLNPYM